MVTEAQKRALRTYYRKNKDSTRCYMLRMNRKDDADVIEKIDSQESKVGYIKELVRKDLQG